jgi:hypothetical protein
MAVFMGFGTAVASYVITILFETILWRVSEMFRSRYVILVACLLLSFSFSLKMAGASDPAYPASIYISSIIFDGSSKDIRAPGSDNWPVTWADDGNQYTSWGDGGGFGGDNSDGRVSLGVGRVEGTKDDYSGYNVWGGKDAENPAQFGGKSHGIISIDGTLYLWRSGDASNNSSFDFQELYKSTNQGAGFNSTGVLFCNNLNFGECSGSHFSDYGFFAPTFIQFGRGFGTGKGDNYVYMYAPEVKQPSTWDVQTPGEVSLIRVPKGSVENKASYEYYSGPAGGTGGTPTWTSNVDERAPVWQDTTNGVMRVHANYNSDLDRYFLLAQQIDRHRSDGAYIGIYEAPNPWGPWKTVLFDDPWDLPGDDLMSSSASKTVAWGFSNKWASNGGLDFVMVYTDADEWATIQGSFTVSWDNAEPQAPKNVKIIDIQ